LVVSLVWLFGSLVLVGLLVDYFIGLVGCIVGLVVWFACWFGWVVWFVG
jgi:hypothetical protein